MGSEACPFCGKTYKRLKSHLPHCKAAASSRAPPAPRDAPAQRTLAATSHTGTKQGRKSKNEQLLSSPPAASASRPPSAENTKQKLSAQIETASPASPASTSLISAKSKNESRRALTEADKRINTPKTNTPLMKKAAESLCTSKRASDTSRNKPCVDSDGEAECVSVDTLLIHPGSAQQGRITLQDVRATLRRTKASRLSITSQTEAADDLSLSSERASLFPLQHDASPEPKLASVGPLLSGHMSRRAAPLSHTISASGGLKVGHHKTGPLSVSPAHSRDPRPQSFPLAPRVGVEAAEGLQLTVTKENPAEGALTRRRLGQVTLRELPEWLACRTPTTPRDLLGMVQRGWQWYHRRYIDVKKGGAGGVGMLLAGYCVLSYAWSYPHLKRDRWRKYH